MKFQKFLTLDLKLGTVTWKNKVNFESQEGLTAFVNVTTYLDLVKGTLA